MRFVVRRFGRLRPDVGIWTNHQRENERCDEVDEATKLNAVGLRSLIRESFVAENSRRVCLVYFKMEWNDDIVFKFIQKIQLYPCLWNPGDKNKKNRNKVHDAFKTIAEEMGTENIDELKKKKESLFQTYRGYRRKVFCSQKSGAGTGDIYKPTWPPYSFLDNFLHGIYTPKGKVDTLVSKNNLCDFFVYLQVETN